jgi:hypothetical protein
MRRRKNANTGTLIGCALFQFQPNLILWEKVFEQIQVEPSSKTQAA